MANKKSIQLLRGRKNYDPSTSEEILLDGQPFYSEKYKALYMGDGYSPLKDKHPLYNLSIVEGKDTETIDEVEETLITQNLVYVPSYSIYEIDPSDTETSEDKKELNYIDSNEKNRDNVIFGAANKQLKGSRNLIAGKLNSNNGSDNLIVGTQNAISGNANIVGGNHETIQGASNIVVGEENNVYNNYNTVSGYRNSSYSNSSIIAGESNTNGNSDNPIVGGYGSAIVGQFNLNTGKYSIVGGLHNINSNQSALIIGEYNNNNKDNTLFEVGNGKSDSERSNAFEIYRDGRAKVHTSPIDDDDIVRKIDLENLFNSFNLTNGSALDSIIQKYSGTIDSTHYENTNNGESAVVFGEANSNLSSRTLISGKLNKILDGESANSIVAGLKNEINTSPNSCIIGSGNNIKNASSVAIFGQGNKSENSIHSSIMVGSNNTLNGYQSVVMGSNNIIEKPNSCAIGTGLKSVLRYQTIVGRYNSPNYSLNTLFVVGNGTGEDGDVNENGVELYRSNAFEVTSDGRAKVQTAPRDNNDVVNKGYFDEKLESAIILATDDDILEIFNA